MSPGFRLYWVKVRDKAGRKWVGTGLRFEVTERNRRVELYDRANKKTYGKSKGVTTVEEAMERAEAIVNREGSW